MQAGQKLSRHIRREDRESDLEQKLLHIEKFGPVLIEILGRITKAPKERVARAEEGLKKLWGRDTKVAEKQLEEAHADLETLKAKTKGTAEDSPAEAEPIAPPPEKKQKKGAGTKRAAKKT